MMTIHLPNCSISGPSLNQSPACAPILRALPEWFGIEEATLHYIHEIDSQDTFLAIDGEYHVLGFLSLKIHNPFTAEVYVMGVLPDAHGQGIGSALVQAAIAHLRSQGIEYLQVKTLGPSRENKEYAGTRAFYQSVGFRPLEEFPQIWDADNPCLILVQRI
jgi:ribosomal protein S18 acetylase RimI-like enzyme